MSVHWGYLEYIGGYREYHQGISVLRGYHEYIRRGEFDRASMGVGRVSAQLRVWAKEVKMY